MRVRRFLILPVLALAGVLFAWRLDGHGYPNTYYAAAVQSMTRSWNAFVFASLDPGGFITVDKPPLGFWPPAILGRLFGFGKWTLLLPQVVESLLTVVVLWRIVARRFGDAAGILAALALAVTPAVVLTSKVDLPDPLLALLVVCAVWATLRGAEDGRVRWVVLAGAFLGAGFATKTLAAFLILPALAAGYWIAATGSWRARVARLAAGAGAIAVCSSPWLLAVWLTPAAGRPFIGGSEDNSALGLVTSRTGFDQFGPIGLNGFRPPGFGGRPGITRLFNDELAGQGAWFLALALVGAAVAVWQTRDRRRLGAIALFAIWLVSHFFVFSYATGIFHAYYLVALAPAASALVGIGLVAMADAVRASWRRAAVVGASLAVAALAELAILGRAPHYLTWLRPTLIACAALGLAALALPRVRTLGVGLAAGALLLPPAAWSIDAVGSSFYGPIPLAGPYRFVAPGGYPFVDARGLADYLRARRHGERWDLATVDAIAASPLILEDDLSVAALGGFLGEDPGGTPASVARLVERRRLRFFLAGPPAFGFYAGVTPALQVMNAVRASCPLAVSVPGGLAKGPELGGWLGVLYDCEGKKLIG